MTTAHRATWKAARGGLQEEGSFRLHVPSAAVSSKDAPTEEHLKARVNIDISQEELRGRSGATGQPLPKRQRKSRFGSASELQLATSPRVVSPAAQSQSVAEIHSSALSETNKIHQQVQTDSAFHNSAELETHSDDPSEAESDDDEAELLAELENIRKERAYERAKKRAGRQTRHENQTPANAAGTSSICTDQRDGEFSETASVATGSVPGFTVQRRWNEDVVFRSDVISERSKKQRFINDTIRNDYHRKFMKRHVK